MNKFTLLVVSFLFSIQVSAQSLPGRHILKQNEKGEYYVVNKDNITMIEASILKMGHNARWILACIKHVSVDTDLKRWVFVDVRSSGGTFDTINQKNWVYFRDEAYPSLKEVKLKDYSEESCP